MRKIIFPILAALIMCLCNCKKDTGAKAQTIVERDTVYVEVHDTTVIPALISDTVTTLIILRHAEKESAGVDPNLDSAGQARAGELKRILMNVPVSSIYSTSYNRTKQTVQPLAAAKGLTVSEYSTSLSYAQVIEQVLAANRGKVAVIVGHSNTVPGILKEVSKNSFDITINESQYDNLFIVSLPDKMTPVVKHLKYGKETP